MNQGAAFPRSSRVRAWSSGGAAYGDSEDVMEVFFG